MVGLVELPPALGPVFGQREQHPPCRETSPFRGRAVPHPTDNEGFWGYQ